MNEREIQYNRHDLYVGTCPCCGVDAPDTVFACDACWSREEASGIRIMHSRGGYEPIRDAMYDLGVRLRAEGKMPPLALKNGETRTVTVNGTVGDPPTRGPSVMGEAEEWGYYVQQPSGEARWMACGGHQNAEAVWKFWAGRRRPPGFHQGPVQRKSDPNPFEARTEPKMVPSCPCDGGYACPQHPAPRTPETPTVASLARALFAVEFRQQAALRAEAALTDQPRVDEVLARMWERKEFAEKRAECVRRAEEICQEMGRRKP